MKKTIIALVATIMAATCIFFACSKEENIAKNNQQETCVMNEDIIVGVAKTQNGQKFIVPTYDEHVYSKTLETNLNKDKNAETDLVVEDIDIFFLEENSQKPMLKVAIFDITNNLSSNIFIYLREIKTEDKSATSCYALPMIGGNGNAALDKLTVTCTTDAALCSKYHSDGTVERGCIPEGNHCTPCPTGYSCTQSVTQTNIYLAICNSF